MNENGTKSSYRRYRLPLIVLLIIGCIFIVVYNFILFRVFSTSPSMSDVPTSAAVISVTFTQPVKAVEGVELAGKSVYKDDVTVDGRTVSVKVPSGTLQEKVFTSLRFSKVSSQWFNLVLKDMVFRFKPKYVKFSDLSEDQRKASVDASNSGQSDDPFLTNEFPIRTDDYSIEASKGYSSSQIFVKITFSKDVPDYDVSDEAEGLSDSEAERLRADAFDTIKKHKGSPDEYAFVYSNQYLNDKYGNREEHEEPESR